MRKAILVFAAMLISHPAPAAGQGSKPAPTDSAQMQGTWDMVSGATSGTPVTNEFLREMRREASGREVTVTWGKEVFFNAMVTLNPATTPKQVDYRLIGGPSAGATQLGIYAISGDTLRFCFSSPGAGRPTDFTTVADDGRTLSVWVRHKN